MTCVNQMYGKSNSMYWCMWNDVMIWKLLWNKYSFIQTYPSLISGGNKKLLSDPSIVHYIYGRPQIKMKSDCLNVINYAQGSPFLKIFTCLTSSIQQNFHLLI